jgi:hypothetical protein
MKTLAEAEEILGHKIIVAAKGVPFVMVPVGPWPTPSPGRVFQGWWKTRDLVETEKIDRSAADIALALEGGETYHLSYAPKSKCFVAWLKPERQAWPYA